MSKGKSIHRIGAHEAWHGELCVCVLIATLTCWVTLGADLPVEIQTIICPFF